MYKTQKSAIISTGVLLNSKQHCSRDYRLHIGDQSKSIQLNMDTQSNTKSMDSSDNICYLILTTSDLAFCTLSQTRAICFSPIGCITSKILMMRLFRVIHHDGSVHLFSFVVPRLLHLIYGNDESKESPIGNGPQ